MNAPESLLADSVPAAPGVSAQALRHVALFARLSDERLADIAKRCAWHHFDSGHQLRESGSEMRSIYIVSRGHVRLTSYGANGRELMLADYTSGSYFGVINVFEASPHLLSAIVTEPSFVARLAYGDFLELLREEPSVAQGVMQGLGDSVKRLAMRMIDLGTLGVRSRVHARLLRMAEQAGIDGNRAVLSPAPRHAELAGLVATTREEVTRELSRLTREGVLGKDGRALVIRDVGTLRQRVEDARH